MKTIDQILLVLTAVVVIYVLLNNKNIENLTVGDNGENYRDDEKNYYEIGNGNKETVDVEYNLINEMGNGMGNENDYELIN